MNSQVNNQTENQDTQIFQEDQFRKVCFNPTSNGTSTNPSSSNPTNDQSNATSSSSSNVSSTSRRPSSAHHLVVSNDNSASITNTSTSTTTSDTNQSLQQKVLAHQIHLHHINLHMQQQQESVASPTSTVTGSSSTNPNNTTPSSNKRNSSSTASSSINSPAFTHDSTKRVRLDPTIINQPDSLMNKSSSSSSNQIIPETSSTTTSTTTTTTTTTTTLKSKSPKFIRRFRSRSLPIINYHTQRHHHHHHQNNQTKLLPQANLINPPQAPPAPPAASSSNSSNIPPLPPINLQSLKEIDLHEILKNPQLRHDILFDPQLQFRPNLDGERGKRKKSIIEKYWLEIKFECLQFFQQAQSTNKSKSIKINRLPILFATLRDILLSLLPSKDRQQVNEIMDIDLLIQQLNHGSFDFVEMSRWLGEVFKSHCAPMRDQWVIEMYSKFKDAYRLNSVDYLVNGLRMIFQILEAMKLDVANHQIRILRPVLIETAVDFERDYFQTLINHHKININDSLNWFYKKVYKKFESTKESSNSMIKFPEVIDDALLKPIIISSIIDLLSCRQMATEFPSTLAFDHTRLVLLRADVRQLVCVQLCMVLYKQLIIMSTKSNPMLTKTLLSNSNILKVQQEILAIVTDDNGNIKWTKNVNAISLQLVRNLQDPNSNVEIDFKNLSSNLIEFSYNWLIKHIQPKSEVYGLMEIKVFKSLLSEIIIIINNTSTTTTSNKDENDLLLQQSMNNMQSTFATNVNSTTVTTTTATTTTTPANATSTTELKNIALRISTLVKFHWSVFGNYYIDHIKSQIDKLAQEEKEYLLKKKQQISSNNNNKENDESSTDVSQANNFSNNNNDTNNKYSQMDGNNNNGRNNSDSNDNNATNNAAILSTS
ncbi:putative Sok1 protein [Scheffersomyces coipomensis]|uniref:putative Sok1 protein n=1 Tax=Scheffersomyces coipomensis TaxID=1788519 RepID=UPI00315D6AF8